MAAAPGPLIQVFGLQGSQATRAAERFFKERRLAIHFIDLARKPIAPGELRRARGAVPRGMAASIVTGTFSPERAPGRGPVMVPGGIDGRPAVRGGRLERRARPA